MKDIHSVLEITVYDEDKDMKKEFIGKIAIPLIMVCPGLRLISIMVLISKLYDGWMSYFYEIALHSF